MTRPRGEGKSLFNRNKLSIPEDPGQNKHIAFYRFFSLFKIKNRVGDLYYYMPITPNIPPIPITIKKTNNMNNKNSIVSVVGWIFVLFSLWQGFTILLAGLPKQSAQASTTPSINSGVKEIKSVDFKNK